MIRLHARPSLTLPSVEARPETRRKTEKESQVADRRGEEGGGRGAELYQRKKSQALYKSFNIL